MVAFCEPEGAIASCELSRASVRHLDSQDDYRQRCRNHRKSRKTAPPTTARTRDRAADLRLRCRFIGVRPRANFSDELAMLDPMLRDRLLVIDATIIAMTEEGRAVARVIAAVFDTYRREKLAQFKLLICINDGIVTLIQGRSRKGRHDGHRIARKEGWQGFERAALAHQIGHLNELQWLDLRNNIACELNLSGAEIAALCTTRWLPGSRQPASAACRCPRG
jgi:hypothetical protein